MNQSHSESGLNDKKAHKRLHIGCGENLLAGWINTDYSPISASVMHMDATKLFPFGDAEFDYIFSEHMIEHIEYPVGGFFLAECFRVLKESGRIRVSTPDLKFLISLYVSEKSDLQKKYIKWATQRFIRWAPYASECFVINNFVRNWDHKFIYDEKTLRNAMQKVGFCNVVRCRLQESESVDLRGLENESRMPAEFLQLETLTLEATKIGQIKS